MHVLGEAVPRDESEAVKVPLTPPGGLAETWTVVRRGYVGLVQSWETGSQGFEGRTLVSAVIRQWQGDTPIVAYEHKLVGPGSRRR